MLMDTDRLAYQDELVSTSCYITYGLFNNTHKVNIHGLILRFIFTGYIVRTYIYISMLYQISN